ncbi:MAG: FeoB-associated Cys-rich membrane protein [Bacteroidetes bacterium]|nr:FeoB-associated Cys-rich membrane protein [Bacteroidota bacterium]
MIDFQTIAVFTLFALAVVYLVYRAVRSRKKKSCGGEDCKCN